MGSKKQQDQENIVWGLMIDINNRGPSPAQMNPMIIQPNNNNNFLKFSFH